MRKARENTAFRPMAIAALFFAASLALTACGLKDADLHDHYAGDMSMDDANWLDAHRQVLADDGIPLTDIEMRALLSTSEFDKGLNHEELRIVQIYFKNYLHSNRATIERFLLRSLPYIEYTRRVFRERGLPEELAYLAFVESGYNPVAVSRSKAVGLWQFMSGTGRQYGLTQDWWVDERYDPYRSTHAAADYLIKLYGDFKDWHLAIAAYNAGEGKIGRALAATESANYFELCSKNHLLDDRISIKTETLQYVPRFLAMCKLMRNAQVLGFNPAKPQDNPKIPNLVAAAELTAKPGTDLAAVARHLGMSWDDFASYNPSFKRYISPPDRHVNIYVPIHAAETAERILSDDNMVATGLTTYTIVRGDTLGRISQLTGTPINVLRQMNPKCEPLQIGARLTLPGTPTPGHSPSGTLTASGNQDGHTIVKGDTLGQISAKTGVSVAELRRLNPGCEPLRIGARLRLVGQPAPASTFLATQASTQNSGQVPSQRATPPTGQTANSVISASPAISGANQANSTASTVINRGVHIVKSGDTLASIAKASGISLTAIRQANTQLSNPNALRIGQKINIPVQVTIYKVQPGDTIYGIARKFNMPLDELYSLNDIKPDRVLHPGDPIKVFAN